MNKVLLLKFGELFLKGRNRREFLKLLRYNIEQKLKGLTYKLSETQGRLVVSNFSADIEDELISRLQKVFGLIGVASAVEIDTVILKNMLADLMLKIIKLSKLRQKELTKLFL